MSETFNLVVVSAGPLPLPWRGRLCLAIPSAVALPGIAAAGVIPLSSLVRHDQALITSEFDVPRLCDLNGSSAVLDSAEWAVACQIDGRATVGELAGRCGIPLHDAMDRVNRLIRSGLCVIAPVPADARVLLPRRVPETTGAALESRRARLDLGLLRQILDGLNSLD